MSRALNDLDSKLFPLACTLIARASEHLIPVMIITTLRTEAEQAVAVAGGFSWTMQSKHLPQPPDGKALAIDLCPYALYDAHGPDKLNWDETHPAWQVLGTLGQSLGLKWGVVSQNGKRKDLGHFEYQEP